MRTRLFLLLAALSAPAHATESMTCSASGKDSPSVGLVIGHAAEPVVAQAHFWDGKTEVKVEVSQAFIDDDKVWVNLGNEGLMTLVAKLRAAGKPGNIRGTLTYKDRSYPVRCSFDDE